MMDKNEFTDSLVKKLWEDSGMWLPYPPGSSHDRVQYLAWAGKYLCPEYLFKWPQLEWPQNPALTCFYEAYPQERQGFNMDRRWNLHEFLRLIPNVPGDTIECGTYEGASSWIILQYAPPYEGKRRIHYIFDSFEGCSEPDENDSKGHFRKGILACSEEEVKIRLSTYKDRIKFFKGWIPERFHEAANARFAFAHLDVDLYQPTRDSIEFIYPRLNDGGVLLCDDYGSSLCSGATKAIDEFLYDKKEKMLAFASGGGFLLKGKYVE